MCRIPTKREIEDSIAIEAGVPKMYYYCLTCGKPLLVRQLKFCKLECRYKYNGKRDKVSGMEPKKQTNG